MTVKEQRDKQKYIDAAHVAESKYGIPRNLLVGVMGAESNFNPNATSPVGARGLMQFMPETAKAYGIDPLNPDQSIDAAGKYLASSYKQFGNWDDTLRSYNMGVGGLKKVKAGKRNLPKETAEYTGRVYKHAGKDYSTEITPKQETTSYANNVVPYLNQQQTTAVSQLQIPTISANFTGVRDTQEVEKEDSQLIKEAEEVKQQTNEYNFLKNYQEQLAQQEEQPIQVPTIDVTQTVNEVSQFVDTEIAQQGRQKPKQFILNYINSPKYKERLRDSNYENVDEEVKQRLLNSNPVVVPYKPQGWVDKILGEEPMETGSYFNNISEVLQLDKINDVKNFKKVYPNLTAPKNSEIEVHERSHASTNDFPQSRLNITDVRKLNNYHKKDSGANEHDLDPDENKADLDAFRYLLKQQGIYDAGTQAFTKEHLKKAKASASKDRLRSVYSDDAIIYLMNHVADSSKSSENNVAQQGVVEDNLGYTENEIAFLEELKNIPVSSRGMYDYPKQRVVVPTDGSITMKNIPHKIKAISIETGETKVLKPSKDYFFKNTKNVLEEPILK